jgi:hypothetical protein
MKTRTFGFAPIGGESGTQVLLGIDIHGYRDRLEQQPADVSHYESDYVERRLQSAPHEIRA